MCIFHNCISKSAFENGFVKSEIWYYSNVRVKGSKGWLLQRFQPLSASLQSNLELKWTKSLISNEALKGQAGKWISHLFWALEKVPEDKILRKVFTPWIEVQSRVVENGDRELMFVKTDQLIIWKKGSDQTAGMSKI